MASSLRILIQSAPNEPHLEDRSVSASMAASLHALEKAKREGLTTQQSQRPWIDDTIRSLLKRLVYRKKQKAFTEFTLEALEAIAHCLEQISASCGLKHPSYASAKDKRFWRNIIALWRRDPVIYEQPLTPLLKGYKFRIDLESTLYNRVRRNQGKTTIESQVLATAHGQRYALLRWILLNRPEYHFDIEDGEQIKRKAKTMKIPNSILFALPSADALRLFDRFEAHCPGLLKVEADSLLKLDVEVRVAMLRLFLREDSDAVIQDAQKQVLHCKKMSEEKGPQPVRAAWIAAAFYFAVASRSLDLLEDVIIWARRFNRDAKTVVELYGFSRNVESPLQDQRALRLMSGIPARILPDKSAVDIQRNVCRGNKVMLALLDTAIQAQSQPSFDQEHWVNVKLLFKKVVRFRLEWVDDLQYRLQLDDEQIHNCVWKDTISTLIKAEELGFSPENQSLQLRDMNGLMQFSYTDSSDGINTFASAATLQFIDELAKSREDLWKRQRAIEHPAVGALQPPWPRGLPVQALFPPHIDLVPLRKGTEDENGEIQPLPVTMPYLEKRAVDLVFMPAEHALSPPPAENEAQAAIGRFIDHYSLALYIYVNLGGPHDWQRRLQDAWIHASQHLSGARMSASERVAYWQEPFKIAGFKLPFSKSFDLKLPIAVANSQDPVIWSPGPSGDTTDSARRMLDVLTIDCFVNPAPVRPVKETADYTRQCYSWVEAKDASLFWDMKAQRAMAIKFSRETKDALIATALLLADARAQAGCKILSEPFPSPGFPRFPAMLLDDKLIRGEKPSDKEVIGVLERFISTVPHALLEKLAITLTKKTLDDPSQSSTFRKWTSAMTKLLAWSRKPDLAADLILSVVLSTPGENPWHRSLLHNSVLQRFPNEISRELLQRLVDDALQRLANQPDEAAAAKMLTQLLSSATFLDKDFVVQNSISLFLALRNNHVRALAVTGLATVLASSPSETILKTIVSFLETHVVPIAAELDERSPMTDVLWSAAENARETPNVYDGSDLPSVRCALIDLVKDSHPEIVKSQGLIEKVLRPLLQKSQENNSRWVSIFLRKHNASELAALLPKWPVWPQLVRLLFGRFTSQMTAAEFAETSDALIFSQFGHKVHSIVYFNKQLKQRPGSRIENDIQHWHRCMAGIQFPEVGMSKVLLKADFESTRTASEQHLLTPRHLQEHEEKVLKRLVNAYESDAQSWHRYLDYYKPPVHDHLTEEELTNWRERCRPVLQQAIKLIDSVRTPFWENDPNRHPSTLPDTYELSLRLLAYPNLYFSSQRDQCLGVLCCELREIIERLVLSPLPYHTRYSILLLHVKENCALQDLMPIALNLGDLNYPPNPKLSAGTREIVDHLCIDAVCEIMDHVLKMDWRKNEALQPAAAMLESWKRCPREVVRKKGMAFLEKLEGADDSGGR